jgi:hypothetical protein
MADASIDQIFSDSAKWIGPHHPRFEVGQLWQCDGRDTWRVIGASKDGMIATLQVLAYSGRPTDSYRTCQRDQREWHDSHHWRTVHFRLMDGEVLP